MSALNEYSHRINSHIIKPLQISTSVGSERGMEREVRRVEDKTGESRRKDKRVQGVRKSRDRAGDASHFSGPAGRLQGLPRPWALSPLDDPAPLCLHWERGNGRRIYCWVLTCTHSWCCFSPLGPSAIPKASKTTGCQVVTAGFKQLLQQPCTRFPASHWSGVSI